MKIISANANGIRSAARKGFFEWLQKENADVVCIQETKAQIHQLDEPVFSPEGYERYFVDAEKKGYSGVAIYSRVRPDSIVTAMGCTEFDREGRYIEARYDDLSVISLYVPSGSSGEDRQAAKDRFIDFFGPYMAQLSACGRRYIICGDWNIAHKNEDLRNWRGNLKNSGFLPHERAWLDHLFDQQGYVDAFRELPQVEHEYTWWSNRGQAWNNNVGWRIDYQILSANLRGSVRSTKIYRDERFSDHAPLIHEYDFGAITANEP